MALPVLLLCLKSLIKLKLLYHNPNRSVYDMLKSIQLLIYELDSDLSQYKK